MTMMMMMMMMMMSLKAASFPSEVLGKNSQMPKTDLLVLRDNLRRTA